MDSGTIINELTQGMEMARQLKASLNSKAASIEARESLIQSIICSYDRALWFVKWGGGGDGDSGGRQEAMPPMLGLPESPVSIDESPQSGEFNRPFDGNQQDQKIVSKKRKTMPTWRNQVRICTENGLEGNTDDGYSWRKYGQKDILGAKFPRSYYRCTYRYVHSCMARKQVQRTDEDPTVFEITYRGTHNCNHTVAATNQVLPPASPEKLEHNHHQPPLPPPKSGEILSNLRESLRVSTSSSDATFPCSFSFPAASFGYTETENYQEFNFTNEIENNNILQGYSPSFISPATSGSNYFTEWGYDDLNSNLPGMISISISTTASATNSPLDLSPNFPFNNSGFFK